MVIGESSLHQNLWERYSFRGDSFETGWLAVIFGVGLSLETAYNRDYYRRIFPLQRHVRKYGAKRLSRKTAIKLAEMPEKRQNTGEIEELTDLVNRPRFTLARMVNHGIPRLVY